MADSAAVRAKMGDWLGVKTVRLPDSVRLDVVNIIRREIVRELDLRYGEFQRTLSPPVGQATLDLTSGLASGLWTGAFLEPRLLRVAKITHQADASPQDFTPPTYPRTLDYLPFDEFVAKFSDDRVQDEPTHYSLYGNLIYFGPVPSAFRYYDFFYYSLPADLIDPYDELNVPQPDGPPINIHHDGLTNDALMDLAWETILWGALGFVSRYLIEDERMGVWDQLYLQGKADLAIVQGRARTTGRIAQAREEG